MAKQSRIAKNEQRRETVARYAGRRAELTEIIRRPSTTEAEHPTRPTQERRRQQGPNAIGTPDRHQPDGA